MVLVTTQLGFWEGIYNPNFKPLEFEGFRKQAGLNSFVMTPKRWSTTPADNLYYFFLYLLCAGYARKSKHIGCIGAIV